MTHRYNNIFRVAVTELIPTSYFEYIYKKNACFLTENKCKPLT